MRLRTAPALAILVGALCVFGLVMVGSASPIISLGIYGSPWAILIRQAMYMGVGTCGLLLFARMDYRKWRKIRGPLVLVTIGLLVVVLVPHLGVSAGGSSRWIGFGMLQLQPSELMKLALVVFAADLLTRRANPAADPKMVLVPVLAVLGISGVLILKQPDMGTALVLSCIAFGILFMGGVPMAPIMKVLGAFAGLALIVGLADPYRRDRILSFLNPGASKSGTGYQVWQSLIGLGSGHIFGLGLGGGREKYGTLPNAHTDFIFSVVGEELGLIGAFLLLALFFALAWYGLRAATAAPDRFGSLLAVGYHHLDHQPGGDQHRRGDRRPAGHRHPAALRLLRRVVAGRHHGRRRHPHQHRRPRALGAHRRPAWAAVVPPVSAARYALVAGGGTAGHLQPALAIAEALVDAGHGRDSIEFVGSTRGQDRVTLEGRGFPFTLLPGRGIVRGRRVADIWRNLGAVAGLVVATVRAFALVVRARPRVVVSVGGYASLPASSAAVVLGVPLVLVNVDAVPGAANRLFGRFARASAVGWPGNPLPRSVVTGTPVRPAIAGVRPRARSPPPGEAGPRPAGGSPHRGGVRWLARGPTPQRRRGRPGRALEGPWRPRRSSTSSAGGTGTGVGRPVRTPTSVGPTATRDSAWSGCPSKSGWSWCTTRRRPGRVPGRRDDGGRAGGGRRALHPGPAPRCAGRPPDRQRPSPRTSREPHCSCPIRSAKRRRWPSRSTASSVDPSGLEAMGRAARSLGRPDAAAAGARVVEANARPVPAGRSA